MSCSSAARPGLRTACWLLAMAVYGCGSQASRSIAATGSATATPTAQVPASDVTLAELVALYRRYELPLPSVDAVLVRVKGGARTMLADGGERQHWHLGFWVPRSKVALVGTIHHEPDDLEVERVEPAASVAGTVDAGSYGLPSTFDTNVGLAAAVQCAARGHAELARALLERSLEVAVGHHFSLFYHPPGLEPAQALAHVAFAYYAGQLTRPGSDLAVIHRQLRALVDSGKLLLREGPQDAEPLLRSLQASLEPRTATPGSIEALIDDLVDMAATRGHMAHGQAPDAYQLLLEQGFDAVPALIAHLDDERLTRSVRQGFNNFPTYHERLDMVVSDLLQDLAGQELGKDWLRRQQGYSLEPAAVQSWWATAQKMGEEAYLTGHVLPRAPEAQWPHRGMLPRLVARYPHQLPAVYEAVLARPTHLESWPVAKAITQARLPVAVKRRLFVKAAQHPDLEHRRAAFWELKAIDPQQFATLLVATLRGLKATPTEPYWRCREGAFAVLVLETDDPVVWQELLRTAKRSDVGLRLEHISRMTYQEPRRAQRLAMLEAFLDDSTVRDVSTNPKLYDGPHAAMSFPVITVRDFAAMMTAYILKLPVEPEPSWTPAQWQQLRADVRRALAAERQP